MECLFHAIRILKGDDVVSISRCPKEEKDEDEDETTEESGTPTLDLE